MPFEIQHHAAMLADTVRLNAFRHAIENRVSPTDCVVDIGTGTGILASYAAVQSKKTVYAIEYFSETANIASQMARASGLSNLKIVQGSSYSRPIDASPDVLISETIGALGPEENIVEICYEFCKRYPGVKTLIPYELTLYAVAVSSDDVDAACTKLLNSHLGASHGTFAFENILPALEEAVSRQLFQMPRSSCNVLGDPFTLAHYELGKTKRSDFSTEVSLSNVPEANAVHFFFIAKLDSDTSISSFVGHPVTHWGHAYLKRPKSKTVLQVSYASQTRTYAFKWRDSHDI
jgi:type I protein arginine methyltransferase